MNIPIRHGRAFDERDRDRGVAVLSEKAARLLWPDDPAPVGRLFMGKTTRSRRSSALPPRCERRWTRIRRRTPTIRTGNASRTARPSSFGRPAIRRRRCPAFATAIRRQDAQLPIAPIRTMDEIVDGSVARRRFQSILMAVFAASALIVASLGIYGVVAYSVVRRRNELGIRMALGARRAQLLGLVIRQGMMPVVIGLAAGVAVALLAGQSIRGLLFEVQPTDPLTIAGVSVALLCVELSPVSFPRVEPRGRTPSPRFASNKSNWRGRRACYHPSSGSSRYAVTGAGAADSAS